MVKKSAKSAKSKSSGKAVKSKTTAVSFINELKSAARASAARRMKK